MICFGPHNGDGLMGVYMLGDASLQGRPLYGIGGCVSPLLRQSLLRVQYMYENTMYM